MKKTCLLILLTVLSLFNLYAQSPAIGAWKTTSGDNTSLMLITPGYFSIATYNKEGFVSTTGGTWEGTSDDGATTNIEFNSKDSSQVGKHPEAIAKFEGDQLVLTLGNETNTWTRVDDGNSVMAGVWQITGREANGKMNQMKPGARKTIKILTGTKFQWVAINTETGGFFGTGGGTYTFDNGVYTEKIEFFSRDNSRVGASLTFKGVLNGDTWDHSGKSSKGDPIHEEWTRK
ncbi:membrane or secreted protein [Chitinophaga tropicalis]|uniref:Membrane or secreted protein n=1 Tax=Chitinophaga tropicalis TaxID=2683588 RepID=A0A7K1U0Y0_9BACT|nr:membrane or secreted protein [Chitinophaga tropicalis]MVT07950.1 membrane or secreted protein [Chitinophaga tropicalis]